MSSHIRCRTAAEIARDGDFITKGCGVDEMATFMLCQRSIHVTCSTGHAGWNPSARLPCGLGRSRPKSSSKELAREVMDGSAVSVGPHAGMISKEVLQSLFPARAVPRRILHGLVLREDQDCLDRNARGVWLDGYGSPGGPVIALNSRPHRHGLIRAPLSAKHAAVQVSHAVVTDKAGDQL